MRTLLGVAALVLAAACNPAADEANTDTTTMAEAPAPAAPTMVVITEEDARSRIEGAGYTNVTGLTQNSDGTWNATGIRDGTTTTVTVNDGGVSATTTTTTTP
jgi:hypothetical protein